MGNLFKISAIIGIMVIAVLASALALGLVDYQASQEALFRVLAVLIIITLASALISFVGHPKK